MEDEPTYTRAQVMEALNSACNDIADAAELPDEGIRDALNLLVNASLHYLANPDDRDLSNAVDANYNEANLAEILEWIDEA